MKWLDYREQLGIGFDDDQKTVMFKNKLTALLRHLDEHLNRFRCDFTPYFEMVGETPYGLNYDAFQYVAESIIDDSDLRIVLSKVVAFINTVEDCSNNPNIKKEVCDYVSRYLASTKICFDLIEDEDGIFIFLKGAKELDNTLVSQPLEWLATYPKSRTSFVKALKAYSEVGPNNASEVADMFRKALEAFFQDFFGGQKSLENYKSDYGKYLKKQNIPKEIRGNFETILQSYTQFINNYAKHRDATSDKVLEYIMYQTGNIIRLLITLKQKEPTDAN